MRDVYCSYYTDSADITSYMVSRLQPKKGDRILEPSAGEGLLIDAIIRSEAEVSIEALDINESAVITMKQKYSGNAAVNVRRTDTLFDAELDLLALDTAAGGFDKVIGNPPYGAWQDKEKRALLKERYEGQYVKESYALFLTRCLSVLKIGGRLSFIIPDTFLFLKMHSELRRILLTNAKLEEIIIFPSYYFPGVCFGYSNICIITLEKCDRQQAMNNRVRIMKGFKSPAEFSGVLKGKYLKHHKIFDLMQSDVYATEGSRFILADEELRNIIDTWDCRLGDVADVATGFYSGDNSRFICALHRGVKNSKNYQVVPKDKIYASTSLDGITDVEEAYVPYIKRVTKIRYICPQDEWFVRWDSDTVRYYLKSKTARFQNSQYYFKRGIAIPMVKSKVLCATIMEGKIFDQSIVGIFPKEKRNYNYILALMNSDIINRLIHVLNPTANNSSNYIKQLPYREPPVHIKREINKNVERILSMNTERDKAEIEKIHARNSELIERIYSKQIYK